MENRVCKSEYNKEYYIKNKENLNEYSKKYNTNNKESILKNKKDYYNENLEKIKESKRIYYIENKVKIQAQRKEYRLKNKDKISIQKVEQQRKYLSTINGKLMHNIRASIRRSLIESGYTKKYKSEEILGCSINDFKLYLESKFESWMTWDNKGLYNGYFNYGWDIDHIIPLATAKTEDDIITLNHYTNLQPLCSKVNRDVKKDNIIKTD